MMSKYHHHDRQPRRRGWFWRMCFSIFMGIAAWWGVLWLLSPKPLYTLSYPARFDREHETPIDWFQADLVDQLGNLLLVQQGTFTSDAVDDWVRKVIDLPTGKVLVTYQLPEVYQFENGTIRTYHLHHPWFGSSGNVIVIGTSGSSKETSRDCYWEWNLITNQKRLLHHDHEGSFYPSDDGSTLHEQFKFPLSPFQGLFPGNVLGVVSSELFAHSWQYRSLRLNVGVTCRRFWSLPEVSNRCTITTPSYVDSGASNLSNDGRWLILYDHFLDSDSETTHQTNSPSVVPSRSPNMIKVYDTLTGKLWCEIPAPPLLHQTWKYLEHGFSTIYPVVHVRDDPDHSNGTSQPKKKVWRRSGHNSGNNVIANSYLRYFHLPTKTWLDLEGENSWFQEVPAEQGNIASWLRHSINSDGRIEISATDHQGNTRQAGYVELNDSGYSPILIAHSTQMVFQRQVQHNYPDWVIEQCSRFNWLAKWLGRQHHQEIVVYDYERKKTLWRMVITDDQNTRVSVTPTGSFLVISRLVDDHYEVAVLALPIANWSHLWSLTTGTFVALFTFWLLVRRKKLQQVV